MPAGALCIVHAVGQDCDAVGVSEYGTGDHYHPHAPPYTGKKWICDEFEREEY